MGERQYSPKQCWENLTSICQGMRLSSAQSLSCVRLFATPWAAACQTFLFITNSQSLLKLMSIEMVMPSNCLILCWSLLLPSSSQHQDLFFPERNLHIYFHLIYDKRDKKLQWRKDSLFNMWCWENWTVSCKRRKSEQYLTPHININCKWIKDLNVRLGIIKTLEKNRQNTLWHKSQKDLL